MNILSGRLTDRYGEVPDAYEGYMQGIIYNWNECKDLNEALDELVFNYKKLIIG